MTFLCGEPLESRPWPWPEPWALRCDVCGEVVAYASIPQVGSDLHEHAACTKTIGRPRRGYRQVKTVEKDHGAFALDI